MCCNGGSFGSSSFIYIVCWMLRSCNLSRMPLKVYLILEIITTWQSNAWYLATTDPPNTRPYTYDHRRTSIEGCERKGIASVTRHTSTTLASSEVDGVWTQQFLCYFNCWMPTQCSSGRSTAKIRRKLLQDLLDQRASLQEIIMWRVINPPWGSQRHSPPYLLHVESHNAAPQTPLSLLLSLKLLRMRLWNQFSSHDLPSASDVWSKSTARQCFICLIHGTMTPSHLIRSSDASMLAESIGLHHIAMTTDILI